MSVEKKEQIKEMKKEMKFLSAYLKKLRMYSNIYDEGFMPLKVEDKLSDYIHYTKSIIDCRSRNVSNEDPVLKAMERLEIKKKREEKQHAHAYLILAAIEQLSIKDRTILLDFYIREYPKEYICQRQGAIVMSTLYRRIEKALLNLYPLLR